MMKNLLSALAVFITFISNSQTGLSNMSFETWGTFFSTQQPVGWFGMTVSQQTSGAQQGTSYARVVTTNTANTGIMTLATIVGTSIKTGAPYNQKPASLTGFYKCSGLAAGDTVGIQSYFMKAGSLLNYDYFLATNNVSNWTSFSLPYSYFSANTPDTAYINCFSNYSMFMYGGGANAIGSTLDVDNLSFIMAAGIDELSIGTSFLVYPNPASNELNILSKDNRATSVVITDVNGKVLDQLLIASEKTRIDLENYPAGIYFYSIENKEKAKLLSSKFVVTK